MRSLVSAALVMTALGLGAPALAAESERMDVHPAPVVMRAPIVHAPAADPPRTHGTVASVPAGAAHHDPDHDRDHHHHRHHGDGFFLPYDFYDQGPAPQLVAQPDDTGDAPAVVPDTPAADQPPCRETTAGVVILRGTGCTR